MPTRLAMKFGVSLARTPPLPSVEGERRSPGWSRISGCGGRRADQLHQVHVARRVEEVHATEAGLQAASAKPSDSAVIDSPEVLVAEDRMRGEVRGHLLVEVVLPVHALGDGLDHQVALAQQGDVVLVVGGADQGRPRP